MTLVLDASVALSWFFDDERDPAGADVLRRVSRVGAIVPGHWRLEIANALLVALRRGRTTSERLTEMLRGLRRLSIETDDETAARAWDDVLGLAKSHRLTVYDAAYLELCVRRTLPLATADRALRDAARRAGVELV